MSIQKIYADRDWALENLASKQEVSEQVAALVDSAPGTLDTLNELAAALGDDPNFATTIATEVGKKVNKTDYNDSIAAINANIDSLQEASEQHLNKTDYLGPVVLEGNPVTYDNGVEGFDIKVETTFGPKQSGSGDPYPVGSRKNLFYVAPQTVGGITVSKNADGAYVLNGTSTSILMIRTNCSYPEGTYILSSQSLPQGIYVRIRDAAGTILGTNNIESTLDHMFTGAPGMCEFTIAADTTLNNVVIKSQLEIGGTVTDWEPSENIRTITGYDKLRLNVARKNLLNPSILDDIYIGYTSNGSDGNIIIDNTSTATVYPKTLWTNLPAGTYTISYAHSGSPAQCYLQQHADDYTLNIASALKKTITLTKAGQVRLLFVANASYAINATVQLELGSTATSFEPYQGNTYTIQIGQTIYGGKINWNTGKLISDIAMTTLTGTEDWKASATNTTGKSRFYASGIATGVLPPPDSNTVAEGLTCSHYKAAPSTLNGTYRCVQSIGIYTTGATYFYDDRYAEGTADDWKAYVAAQYAVGTPIQFTYKLKTPIEIQLTPTQISELESINTLYGDGDNIRAIFKSTGGTSTTLETISGILPVEKGGTGATSAAGVRNNLGITPANIGAVSKSGDTMTGDLRIGSLDSTTGTYLRMQRAVGENNYTSRFYTHGETGAACVQSMKDDTAVNHMYLKEEETTFKQPVSISSGGTGATSRATAWENIVAGGGTFKNVVNFEETPTISSAHYYSALTLKPKMGSGRIATIYAYTGLSDSDTAINQSLIRFRQYSYEAGTTNTLSYYDQFSFPTTEAGKTASHKYDILTTKNVVTIAQGGTEATTAADARTKLNVPSRTGSGASGDWGINITGNAATATALTTSAGSSSQPIYFSSGKPVQVNNIWIGSATEATGRSFDIKRKSSSDASYGRLNIGLSSTGNTSFIEYLHYDTSGTEDQDNLLYISGNSFYPNANTTNLGTSSKKWGTVYATTFNGSGASLTSLNADNISSGTIAAARLPAATSSALGAVKIGSNISVSSGTISLTKSNVTTALGYTPPTVSYTDGASSAGTIGTLSINSSSYTLKERVLNGTGTSLSTASITDLNTIKTPSVYYSAGASVSATLTNAPWTSSGFRLITFAGYGGDSSYGLQVAAASSMLFWRNMGGSNTDPSPWYVVPQIPYTGNGVGSANSPIYMNSNGKMMACTSPSMLVNLGSTTAASVFAASPRPGITGTLAIGHGGTGSTSKSGARTNLGITSGTSLPSSAAEGDIFFLYS